MMLLLAVALPTLFWSETPDTAASLKQTGVERIAVPRGEESLWQSSGLREVIPVDLTELTKLLPPSVDYRINEASATTVPWLNANGWRIQRDPGKRYLYDLSASSTALAAAEGWAYGGDVVIRADQKELPAFASMLRFLESLHASHEPPLANIGFVDDGSAPDGETLNLLARYNLLFRILQRPDPKMDLNVEVGSAVYPKSEAANPQQLALRIRGDLGDDKRLLRIYGTQVVIGHLTGDKRTVRVHLLNYANRPVQGVRVLVRGKFSKSSVFAYGVAHSRLLDFQVFRDRTEFTIPLVDTYAVVDLRR